MERFVVMRAARLRAEQERSDEEAACPALNGVEGLARAFHDDEDAHALVEGIDVILDNFDHRG
jgi:hypothetical protein